MFSAISANAADAGEEQGEAWCRMGTLLIRHSTRCPIVMREGMACGLMMMSGTMPSCSCRAEGVKHSVQTFHHVLADRVAAHAEHAPASSRIATASDLGEGHVLGGIGDADGALLPMAAGKLVSHLRYPDRPHLQRVIPSKGSRHPTDALTTACVTGNAEPALQS
jgi:hypothetical protein